MAGFGVAFAALIMIIVTPFVGALLTLVAIRLSENELITRKVERKYASIAKERFISQTRNSIERAKLSAQINNRKNSFDKTKTELFKLNTDINEMTAELNRFLDVPQAYETKRKTSKSI